MGNLRWGEPEKLHNTHPTLIQVAHSQVVHFIQEGITDRNPMANSYWPFHQVCSCGAVKGSRDRKCLIIPLAQKISENHRCAQHLCYILSPGTPSYPGGRYTFWVLALVWLFLSLVCRMVPAWVFHIGD